MRVEFNWLQICIILRVSQMVCTFKLFFFFLRQWTWKLGNIRQLEMTKMTFVLTYFFCFNVDFAVQGHLKCRECVLKCIMIMISIITYKQSKNVISGSHCTIFLLCSIPDASLLYLIVTLQGPFIIPNVYIQVQCS